MKTVRDYICPKCENIHRDVYGEYGDYPTCEECGGTMEFLPTTMAFSTYFSGSHKSEYGYSGKLFNGFTKEQATKPIDDYEKMRKKQKQKDIDAAMAEQKASKKK